MFSSDQIYLLIFFRLYSIIIIIEYPPMAQLDNATDSDSGDRGFKSLWAGQNNNGYPKWVPVIIRPKGFEGERAVGKNSPVDCF